MKTVLLTLFVCLIFLMASCTSATYFQVYKTVPSDNSIVKDNSLVYEDENCKVYYDFWADNGNIGFKILNKTDITLYLNLSESYFILNGIAHNYFQNRTFTNSKNTGATTVSGFGAAKSVTGINYSDLLQTNKLFVTSTAGISLSEGYSVSYTEEKIIAIPSNTAKLVSEYSINSSLYRDCDLYKYPNKNQIKTKTFTKATSPLIFSNRLVYWLEKDMKPIKFVNEFYVTEITNYAEPDITELSHEEFCEQKSTLLSKYFKDVSPDKFYLKYKKDIDPWKH